MTGESPQVSVVIPVTSTDVEPGALVEGYGSALGVGGYSYEFVFVLDGVAGRVLDEIHELSKIYADRAVLNTSPILLREVVSLSEKTLEPLARN